MPEPAMISVDEARSRILAGLRPTPAEVVALANAWNRVSAEPVLARLTQPPSDVSAMDGYALRAGDGGLHASLRVIGSPLAAAAIRIRSAPRALSSELPRGTGVLISPPPGK